MTALSEAGETLVGITMLGARGGANRLAADAADVAAGGRLVDVGCGPGGVLRVAARRGVRATGVDPSAAMRRLARWSTPPGLRGAIELRDGTAESLPLDDGTADAVVALHSAHHWTDPSAGFGEARRVLVPGGRLVVVERLEVEGRRAHHAVAGATLDEWATRIEAAGFSPPDLVVHRDRVHRALLIALRQD